ncbi:MAG: hypothetical protein ABIG08_01615 [bacterium]
MPAKFLRSKNASQEENKVFFAAPLTLLFKYATIEEPRKGVFKMNKRFLIIAIIAWMLASMGPAMAFNAQKAGAGLNLEEKLAIAQGNSLLAASNPSQPEPKVAKKINVIITAYSSTPCQTDDSPFITASGSWVKDGIIANNLFPFGTKVRIPEIYGEKIFVIEDRMNARKGSYHFDIWFPSYLEAKNFGAKTTYIEILEN